MTSTCFRRELSVYLVVLLSTGFMVPSAAQAYLDPGTGSIVLQAIVGTALGAVFVVRSNWERLKSRLRGEDAAPDRESPQAGQDSSSDGATEGREPDV